MKTQNLVFGRSSGSLGNVVASASYGENIVRSKPLEVYNPQTAKQTNMRTIMADVVQIAKAANQYLAITKRTARTGRTKKMSAYAYLIKDILAAKLGSTPNIILPAAGITLGVGDLSKTTPTTFLIDISANNVLLEWVADATDNQTALDIPSIIMFNITKRKVFVGGNPIQRSDGGDSVPIPKGFADLGDTVAGFLAFEDQNGTIWDAPLSVPVSIIA